MPSATVIRAWLMKRGRASWPPISGAAPTTRPAPPTDSISTESFKMVIYLNFFGLNRLPLILNSIFFLIACQKILQQRLLPSPASVVQQQQPITPRPTTPNHYSTLGRHFPGTGPPTANAPGSTGGNYPGASTGFSSSSLGGGAVVAGSTLGPAGAAIGTGHSSLAGYGQTNNNGGAVAAAGLGGSSHNLHSSASLNTNGALAARGKIFLDLSVIETKTMDPLFISWEIVMDSLSV